MIQLRHDTDTDVTRKIEQAAKAACDTLDELFPGFDNGGITSNFQGLLAEALGHMLKGRSLLDSKRGHSTQLPQLVIDDAFFGVPVIRGEMFLVTKQGDRIWDGQGKAERELLALDPERGKVFRPLSEIGDAYTSFEAAARAAMDYLRDEGATLEQAREIGLKVQPVEFNQARQQGFVFAEAALRAAA